MSDTFEQKKQEDKPRDDLEAKRLGSSRETSEALKRQIGVEPNLSNLPKKEQEKAKQVMSEIKSLIGKTDPESLASINNIMRLNSSLLNSIDPTLIRTLNQELRRIAKEKNQEAARNGNIPVLTAGAMDYIKQGSDIYAEIGTLLETSLQNESKEKSDVQVAQFQSRVTTIKAKLDTLYKNLSKLQTFDANNIA